jgi:NAD(P)-dependent dehydrogenase (short-subunit alcohol dehydrogenase family)
VSQPLAGQVAVVTGASRGIGRAIALRLARDGAQAAVTYLRQRDAAEETVRAIESAGGRAAAFGFDVGRADAVASGIDEIVERFGRLDVLVNNAGLGIGGAVADAETKKLDLQLNVNLRAVYLLARESIPLLKEAGAEHGKALMANTASIAGKHGQGWLAAYSATKFGVVGLSQALHKELSNDGVQVTALCPGFVATPMTDWIEGQVPKEEMIQPEDIAEAIRFLLRTSRNCVVPEIQFVRPADSEL